MRVKLGIQICPSFRDLLKGVKRYNQDNLSTGRTTVLLSRSCFAIELICSAVANRRNRRVNVWIPQYFCGETLNPLRANSKYNLVFYPITEALNPNYDDLKDLPSPDVFLFVHYFGLYLDIEKARRFCDEKTDCVLIEDCAHVAAPIAPFGITGDFSLFSPHKCLPVLDGSVMYINDDGKLDAEIVDQILRQSDSLPRKKSFRQYMKAFLKGLMKLNAAGTYSPVEHFDKPEKAVLPTRISRFSENIIRSYTKGEYEVIVARRKDNLRHLDVALSSLQLPIRLVNDTDKQQIPYFAFYEISDEAQLDRVIETLTLKGVPMGVWTYLPAEIMDVDAPKVKSYSRLFFSVPIHQKICESQIRSIVK